MSTAPRSPPALPSPVILAVSSDPPPVPVATYVPQVDTASSLSPTDSSATTDENTNPFEDLLDACLADLASERNDPRLWAWDALGQQYRTSAVSQTLFDDSELWGLIEALVRLPHTFTSARVPTAPFCRRSRLPPYTALCLLPDPVLLPAS